MEDWADVVERRAAKARTSVRVEVCMSEVDVCVGLELCPMVDRLDVFYDRLACSTGLSTSVDRVLSGGWYEKV